MVNLSHDEKRQIEESARALGVSLSQYMAERALDHARRVLAKHKASTGQSKTLTPSTIPTPSRKPTL